MKFKLAFAFSLMTLSAFSQRERVVDFLKISNDDFSDTTFKYKDKARVKIINVNRFLYKITADKTETDFNTTVPTALTTIKLPGFLTTQMPTSHGAPSPVTLAVPTTSAQANNEIEKNLKELIKAQEFLDAAIDLHNKIVELSKSCSDDYPTIQGKVISVLKAFLIGTTNTTIPTLATELQSKIETAVATAATQSSNIKELMSQWKGLKLAEFRRDSHSKIEAVNQAKDELEDLQTASKSTKDQTKKRQALSDARTKQVQISSQELDLKEFEEDYTSSTKNMETLGEKVTTLGTDISKFKEDGKLYSLTDDIRKVNEANYTYFGETVKMKKDEVKFAFTVSASDQLTCNKPNEEKFAVSLRTRGGLKVDFSTGVFFNFGSQNFLGNEYYYQPINDSISQIKLTDPGKRVLLSIGALMHVYQRSPAHVKLGGSAGVSVSTGFDALNFHIGPSLIIGDKERICISAGPTFREVKVLDVNYELNSDYFKKLLPDAVPTTKKFPETGLFLALTYNFSSFNK